MLFGGICAILVKRLALRCSQFLSVENESKTLDQRKSSRLLWISSALFIIWAASYKKGPDDMTCDLTCVICNIAKLAAVIEFSFKERILLIQLLFPDFYHFHHVIWRIKWAKMPKSKNGQNMSSGPFSHDAAHFSCDMCDEDYVGYTT